MSPNPPQAAPTADTPDSLEPADENPHYVRSVTDTGERNEVVAREDIYAANGMKLLARGARIDRSKWERLTSHKLGKPLDLLLAAKDAVDPVSLARDIERLLADEPLLAILNARSGDPGGWKGLLGRLALPGPLAFRLTVMRDDRRDIYDHSLRVAVIAHAIGVRLALADESARHLLLAALCHDIGETHTDPRLMVPGRAIAPEERRFIHVHPLTGYMVLEQVGGIPQEAMLAVLQHHERLDGSGYPHGLRGERLGQLARIIAVAELADAVVRRFGADRLDVAMRLNQTRLDAAALMALRELLPPPAQDGSDAAPAALSEDRVARLNAALDAWPRLRDELAADAAGGALAFVGERMHALQSLTFQAGLTPRFLAQLDLGGDDAEVVQELNAALDEMLHRVADLAHEIERRIEPDDPAHPLAQRVLALLRGQRAAA